MVLTGLATRLEMVRKRSGLSIREAAAKAGLSFGYVARLHNGERDSPTVEALEALARVYRTSVEYLRDGRPEVDVWAALTRDPQFRGANAAGPSDRANTVVYFVSFMYPGHLNLEDVSNYLGMDCSDLSPILKGQAPLSDALLVGISQLSSVPVDWLRLGHFAFLPENLSWPEVLAFLAQYQGKSQSQS